NKPQCHRNPNHKQQTKNQRTPVFHQISAQNSEAANNQQVNKQKRSHSKSPVHYFLRKECAGFACLVFNFYIRIQHQFFPWQIELALVCSTRKQKRNKCNKKVSRYKQNKNPNDESEFFI